jgi:hypothetical protein
VPNALLWRIPFKSFFIYDSNQGNLCWQWQHRNATTGSSPMDAVSSSFQGINAVAPNSGMGCTATGMSTASSTNFQIAAGNVSVALANGAPTASSILWLGLNRIEVNLGWCTPLYVNPIVQVGGSTNATGAWQAGVAPIAVLALPNYFELHAQFAYLDAGLTGGIGLSDLGTVTGIPHGGRYSARLYSQNNGENAVTGSKTSGFGVITTFSRL